MRSQTDHSEKAELLRATALFEKMNAESEQALLSLAVREFSAGEVIAENGVSPSLGLVISGKASIFGKNNAGKVLLNLVNTLCKCCIVVHT